MCLDVSSSHFICVCTSVHLHPWHVKVFVLIHEHFHTKTGTPHPLSYSPCSLGEGWHRCALRQSPLLSRHKDVSYHPDQDADIQRYCGENDMHAGTVSNERFGFRLMYIQSHEGINSPAHVKPHCNLGSVEHIVLLVVRSCTLGCTGSADGDSWLRHLAARGRLCPPPPSCHSALSLFAPPTRGYLGETQHHSSSNLPPQSLTSSHESCFR